jgi:D-lactate dehydrogenase
MALDTCAVDGLCATDCPVSIDTGKLTKRFRALRHSRLASKLADFVANHFALAESGARFALGAGQWIENRFGRNSMSGITARIDRLSRKLLDAPFWHWSYPMPMPQRGPLPATSALDADAVYYPACISRIMGASAGRRRRGQQHAGAARTGRASAREALSAQRRGRALLRRSLFLQGIRRREQDGGQSD